MMHGERLAALAERRGEDTGAAICGDLARMPGDGKSSTTRQWRRKNRHGCMQDGENGTTCGV